MQRPVWDPKQMANWIAAPKQGIKGCGLSTSSTSGTSKVERASPRRFETGGPPPHSLFKNLNRKVHALDMCVPIVNVLRRSFP